MSITVDGQRYEYKGTVEASKGSGDNKEDLKFTVYTDPEGRECWLGEDKKCWYLYRDVTNAEARLKAGHTHEEFAADKLKILGETFNPAKFSWVTLNERQMAEPGAFRGTDQAMRMGMNTKVSIPLFKDSVGDRYFGPNFPAADIPRRPLALGNVSALWAANLLILALAVIMGVAVWAQNPLAIRVFWWLGPTLAAVRLMSARQGFVGTVCGALSGVFFLHFCTHGLDYLVTNSWEEAAAPLFESARLALFCLLVLGLRAYSSRLGLALIDGAFLGGGAAWLVYLSGPFIASVAREDEGYFPWFSYYASIPMWAWIWPVLLVWGVRAKLKDYAKAPVHRDGFRSLLYRTHELTRQGLGVATDAAERLEHWADDLEDGLSLSADPAVRAFAPLAPDFLQWKKQATLLREIDPAELDEDVRAALENDLTALSQDFLDLVNCLDEFSAKQTELKSLRFSPLLLTWNQ